MSSNKACPSDNSEVETTSVTMDDHHICHQSARCFLGKQSAVIFLVIYTVLMGFMFLSYLYTSDVSTGSASHRAGVQGKDVVVIRKNMDLVSDPQFLDTSMPRPGKPASVRQFFRSMRTGESLTRKCKKCAVISSSGHMLGSKLGKEIDDMPCVIRMNNSPTEGFEEDVGQRTTMRIVCHMSTEPVNADSNDLLSPENEQSRPEEILFFGLNEPNHKWALEKALTMVNSYPEVDFYSLDDFGDKQSDRIFEMETGKNKLDTNTWLSTGWYTILAALDICEEVHIYGIVNENYCEHNVESKMRYHYFQSWDTPTECDYYKSHENTRYLGGHRFLTEKAIFSRWGAMFNMSFHKPEWQPPKLAVILHKPLKTPFVVRDEEDKSALGKLFEHFAKWAFSSMM